MPITVLHVASGDLWAGAEVQIFNLVRAQQRIPEIEVAVVLFNRGELSTRLADAGIATAVADETAVSSRTIIRDIRALAARVQPAVIHSHDYKETILAALACPRIPHLRTVHGAVEPHTGLSALRSAVTARLDRWFCNRRVNCLLSVSDDLAARLSAWARPPVTTIHNGVDLDSLDHVRPADLRSELGIPRDGFLVGMVGRLVPVKRCDMLIRALPANPRTRALFVGDGPERPLLEQLAGALGVGDRVTFLGFRDDAAAVMAALDCLAITSAHEGIPTVLLEAMALRVPVLATRVGGIPEVVDDNMAVLVDSGHADDVAAAVATALGAMQEEPQSGAGRVVAARSRVESQFSAAVQSEAVLRAYRRVLSSA